MAVIFLAMRRRCSRNEVSATGGQEQMNDNKPSLREMIHPIFLSEFPQCRKCHDVICHIFHFDKTLIKGDYFYDLNNR